MKEKKANMITLDPKKIKKFQISRMYKDSNLHSIYIEVDLGDINLEPPKKESKKRTIKKKGPFFVAHGVKA
jgi:hypothetical protein